MYILQIVAQNTKNTDCVKEITRKQGLLLMSAM
jgi:hypothetical protein